jgi:tripartite ATP-independent transporter DctM subunit
VIVLEISVFFVFLLMGMPIAFAMALSALAVLWISGGIPLAIVTQRLYAGADSFTYLAIPFFVFAGDLMMRTRISQQLVRLTTALLGHLRGSTGTADVIASMIFAGMTGSGTADMAAIGSIMIPRLKQRGYPAAVAAALESCAGAIGPIMPPSLLMLIYAGMAEVSVGRMFLGGLVPGVLTGLGLIGVQQIWNARRRWEVAAGRMAPLTEIGNAFLAAIPALVAPCIILGGIVFGIFTPTEAGAVAIVYALLIGFGYRDLNRVNFFEAANSSAKITTMALFPIAAASLFAWPLTRMQFGSIVTTWVLSLSHGSALAGALLVQGALFVLGYFLETLPLMVIFVPILAPLGPLLGFDPVHWGVVTVMCMNLAAVAPPVGTGIFLCSGMAGARVEDTSRYIWPFVIIMFAIVLACLLFPPLVLWLPRLIMK